VKNRDRGPLYRLSCDGAWAQESSRTYRLGILSGGETRDAPAWGAFFDEMSKAGFIEGSKQACWTSPTTVFAIILKKGLERGATS